MNLSCIIVNYYNSAPLKNCLESVTRTLQKISFEVIVVDNSQDDPGMASIKESYPQICYIQNSTNVGFARANNQAVQSAQGEILLFLNPDTILTDQAIEKMVAHLKSNADIGALGPKVLNTDGSLQYSCRRFPTFMTGFFNRYSLLSRWFPDNPYTVRYLMKDFGHDEIREVDWLSGCCLMVLRTAFEKAGGFDEHYFLFNEDVDLCRAIHQNGFKVMYFPSAKITHHISTSNSKVPMDIIIKRHLGMSHYYGKHHGKNFATRTIVNIAISLRCLSQLAFNIFK
ncbi:MAG: glycosyltransferase family 2 protein [Nitrospina sp.]|nr:glycosyltransferase family 2 protein [Nitrospina sp.]MBT3413517.1 glycosyltransferase family 2 protein [Nitrospina sp.]MBT3855645.1 glycosyltransferase family 2 protein [Nitrospina sp.]MBT4104742.1 glycosyltransferase family 2 protein [Nitrospina sp.]MBT4390370.1 glycosyltransferase family 2 protein [Nitrospina sp.]